MTTPTPEPAVKERPIIFSGEMVREILDGRKTQTRRVVKPQPDPMVWENILDGRTHGAAGYSWLCPNGCRIDPAGAAMLEFSPYQVGMRLWVREKWRATGSGQRLDADGVLRDQPHTRDQVVYAATEPADSGPWRPSIHMPRWASRITLEVTSVRVERVQSISEEDAIAEGLRHTGDRIQDGARCSGATSVRGVYAALWDRINGKKHPWSSNPWVWVITFRSLR